MTAPGADLPTAAAIYDVIERTWPAARKVDTPVWTLRDGAGGGKRVSAATARTTARAEDVPEAEEGMRDLGQTPLFMIREGDEAVDRLLSGLGYAIVDPVSIWACATDALCSEALPRTATFAIREPLAIQRSIWAEGGIGPERIAVMERVTQPKTSLFGRHDNRPAATGFAAIHDRVAMVHALEVRQSHRRCGMGRCLMAQAALWARDLGAAHIAIICRTANVGANALYASLGMTLVGDYHYRMRKETDA